MGRDKLGLDVGGKPLVQRAYATVAGLCEEILMVGSEARADYGVVARTVEDVRPGRRGPLAGIEAGLAAARNDRVIVLAGDMPLVPPSLANFLLESLLEDDTRVAVPRYDGRVHPLCAAYRREVLSDLSFALNLGVGAVREFLGSLDGVRYVEKELYMHGDPDIFLTNVNSPEDLARAREHLTQHHTR